MWESWAVEVSRSSIQVARRGRVDSGERAQQERPRDRRASRGALHGQKRQDRAAAGIFRLSVGPRSRGPVGVGVARALRSEEGSWRPLRVSALDRYRPRDVGSALSFHVARRAAEASERWSAMRFDRFVTAVIISAALLLGCGETKPPVDVSASNHGKIYRRDSATLKGTVTKGATVTVNGRKARVSGRRWSLRIKLHPGRNEFTVVADKEGFSEDYADATVTRRAATAPSADSESTGSDNLQLIQGICDERYGGGATLEQKEDCVREMGG